MFSFAGLLLAVWFVQRQRHLAHPLLDLRLFRNAAFAAAISANSMALFAWVGASFLVAQYLQLVLGLSPFWAGLWTLPSAFVCVLACLGAPVLARRVSSVWLVFLGLVLTALGLGVLAALTRGWGLPAAVFGMVLLGLGVSTVVTLGHRCRALGQSGREGWRSIGPLGNWSGPGGSFGVAVLGSMGAALYHRHLVLPTEMATEQAAAARQTLGAALDAASRLPTLQSEALVISARDAFLLGFQAAHMTGAVLLVLTAAAFGWATVQIPAPQWRHRPDSAGSE